MGFATLLEKLDKNVYNRVVVEVDDGFFLNEDELFFYLCICVYDPIKERASKNVNAIETYIKKCQPKKSLERFQYNVRLIQIYGEREDLDDETLIKVAKISKTLNVKPFQKPKQEDNKSIPTPQHELFNYLNLNDVLDPTKTKELVESFLNTHRMEILSAVLMKGRDENLGVVKYLTENVKNWSMMNVVRRGGKSLSPSSIIYLMTEKKFNVDDTSTSGETFLFRVASKKGCGGVLNMLITENGLDVNRARENDGSSCHPSSLQRRKSHLDF
jgi:hypothetical protein